MVLPCPLKMAYAMSQLTNVWDAFVLLHIVVFSCALRARFQEGPWLHTNTIGVLSRGVIHLFSV